MIDAITELLPILGSEEEQPRHYHYRAYHIAEGLHLKEVRQLLGSEPIHQSSQELYYQTGPDQYLYVLRYGVVVFCGWEFPAITQQIEALRPCCKHQQAVPVGDDFEVRYQPGDDLKLSFNSVLLGRFDHAINQMVMLLFAQSVALDHYDRGSQGLLSEITGYTEEMHLRGKIRMSERDTLKFIGKSLSTKNRIVEHLYILDTPDTAWQHEFLDRLYHALSAHLELKARYRAIENTLRIIEENLAVFSTYNQHRESSRLEWIIIILIVIEVVDTFVSKL